MRVEERRNQRNTRGHDAYPLPMSLSVHLGEAEAVRGAVEEEKQWRGCHSLALTAKN